MVNLYGASRMWWYPERGSYMVAMAIKTSQRRNYEINNMDMERDLKPHLSGIIAVVIDTCVGTRQPRRPCPKTMPEII